MVSEIQIKTEHKHTVAILVDMLPFLTVLNTTAH